ncbi:MAG: hypothetical protein KDK63_00410, partial [Chlamydiia bacterium]|nr:hypothetical protein [Chlamydiia bacterium]
MAAVNFSQPIDVSYFKTPKTLEEINQQMALANANPDNPFQTLAKHINLNREEIKKSLSSSATYLEAIRKLNDTLSKTLPEEILPAVKQLLETDPQFIQAIVLMVQENLKQENKQPIKEPSPRPPEEKDKKLEERVKALEEAMVKIAEIASTIHPNS